MMRSRSNPSCLSRIVVGVLCCTLALLATGADADSDGVKLVRLFGQVEVSRSGQNKWSDATERMILRSGDRVRTGDNSWCCIELSENNVMRLANKSRIVLENIAQKSERVAERTVFAWKTVAAYDVKLEEGQAMPVLDHFHGSTMNFSTPVAVAGVRGTVFEATVERLEGSEVAGGRYNVDFAVHEGTIEVTDLSHPDAGGTFVPAGYSMALHNVRVPPGGLAAGRMGAMSGLRGQGAGPAGMAAGGMRTRAAEAGGSGAATQAMAKMTVPSGPLAANIKPIGGENGSGMSRRMIRSMMTGGRRKFPTRRPPTASKPAGTTTTN